MNNSNFFLPYYKNNFQTEKELYDFLTKLYPDSVIVSEQGSCYKSMLSLVLHVCGPISLSALKVYLGDYLTSDSSCSKISRFVKKKLIVSHKLVTNDMNSRTLYAPTRELCSPLMSYTSNIQDELINHKSSKAPLHSYGIGISRLALMQLSIPMDYVEQNKYYSSMHNTSLIVDSEIFFDDTHPWKIFLEQDMGTERTHVLYNKLIAYHQCRLFQNKRSYVVFSSHATIPFLDIPAFNMLVLQRIAAYMESTNSKSIWELYENYNDSFSPDISAALAQILVIIGLCKVSSTSKKTLPIEKVDQNTVLIKKFNNCPFTIETLYHYIDDLKNETNPLPLRLYIQKQYTLCKRKYMNLVERILYEEEHSLLNSLLDGSSIFFTPSMMLNNNYYFYAPEDSGYAELLRKILSNYIKYTLASTYQLVSPYFQGPREYPSLHFRNCFMYEDHMLACVEHISQDVAGYIRAYYCAKWYLEQDYDFTLISLYDNIDDAVEFVEKTKCFPHSHNTKFKLLFLSSDNLSENSPLKYIVQDEDTDELIWKKQPTLH